MVKSTEKSEKSNWSDFGGGVAKKGSTSGTLIPEVPSGIQVRYILPENMCNLPAYGDILPEYRYILPANLCNPRQICAKIEVMHNVKDKKTKILSKYAQNL